jgi:hypothetical protein
LKANGDNDKNIIIIIIIIILQVQQEGYVVCIHTCSVTLSGDRWGVMEDWDSSEYEHLLLSVLNQQPKKNSLPTKAQLSLDQICSR